jgi:hypothetical protein
VTVVATGFEDRGSRITSGLREDETRSFFGNARNFYTAPSFLKKDKEEVENSSVKTQDKEPKEEEPVKRTMFVSKPVFESADDSARRSAVKPLISSGPPGLSKNKSDEDEDLEIPAFIRKKMGM